MSVHGYVCGQIHALVLCRISCVLWIYACFTGSRVISGDNETSPYLVIAQVSNDGEKKSVAFQNTSVKLTFETEVRDIYICSHVVCSFLVAISIAYTKLRW